jgi:hypothetical protein
MTRLFPIRGFATGKNPFVFNGRRFGFANFSKFFLGRNEENQCLAGEKIWIQHFLDFLTSFAAMAVRFQATQK